MRVGWVTRWRMPLRLARRDAWRHRRTSALVLVLITLPVLAVTAASVVWATMEIDGSEALDRRLGGAAALVSVEPGTAHVSQHFDPDEYATWAGDGDDAPATLDDVRRALGGERPVVELVRHAVTVRTDRGVTSADVTETDAGDPLAKGLFDLTAGRWPTGPGEAVVNGDLADRGPELGEKLVVVNGDRIRVGDEPRELEIVGIAESTSGHGYPLAVVGPGALGEPTDASYARTWLVGGDPVSWEDVRRLNAIGATVWSRAVLTDPPPESALDREVREGLARPNDAVGVAALVGAMVLLEVVLLAGPAFAVGARRQSRHLALIAASGGTPSQTRRVVLASAVVLGGAGAVLGMLLGLLAGWAAVPVVAGFDTSNPGPYDVPWPIVAIVAAGGLMSAVLAAFVPAWLASRQDVVAVLAGRRGDRRPSLRSPLLGLLILGAGVAGAVVGARSNNEILIAASAILSVLGMIFLVPVLVVVVARLAARFPLPMRYAARDAARHRTRTVPAVAAVAATVAGVVALGISTSSDEAESEATYHPALPMGVAAVNAASEANTDWERVRGVVEGRLPGARVTPVSGVPERLDASATFTFRVAGEELAQYGWSGVMGASVLVADRLPDVLPGVDAKMAQRADRVLAEGGAVVFGNAPLDVATLTAHVDVWDESGVVSERARSELPGAVVAVGHNLALPQAVLSPAAADRLRVSTAPVGLVVEGGVSRAAEQDIQEGLSAISPGIGLYVERGYQTDGETVVVQLILAGLGAILMLGGTLTATFLALSDARPDLATLSSVGAAPRTRRAVAASYALVVGFVGAVLGAAVGSVPGIAITYPLTRQDWHPDPDAVPSHYLDVPWLMILGLVVALPLLTAAIVGLTARSRLPLVARFD